MKCNTQSKQCTREGQGGRKKQYRRNGERQQIIVLISFVLSSVKLSFFLSSSPPFITIYACMLLSRYLSTRTREYHPRMTFIRRSICTKFGKGRDETKLFVDRARLSSDFVRVTCPIIRYVNERPLCPLFRSFLSHRFITMDTRSIAMHARSTGN